ncbi:MAG: glucose 1-dehydrogenase [Hellea sp.]|nr:glucose 1-dehydrogenase [Hellea sp.]
MARFDFTGKVALIAGASRGIGEAIAHGLAEHGATVICTSRKLEACEKVAEDIRAKGLQASAKTLHLGEIDSHQAVVDEIMAEHGRLDYLVNNGATNPYMGPAHQAESWAFDKTFEVNVKGPYFLSSKCVPLMLQNGGGAIVNVASIDGLNPGIFRVIYGMTKAAVINMTKGFAKEYGQQGVRVNSLLPGFTDTKLASALKENPMAQKLIKTLPIQRMAQPEEMVGAVMYMLSDEGSYFTGQTMTVDGGATIL